MYLCMYLNLSHSQRKTIGLHLGKNVVKRILIPKRLAAQDIKFHSIKKQIAACGVKAVTQIELPSFPSLLKIITKLIYSLDINNYLTIWVELANTFYNLPAISLGTQLWVYRKKEKINTWFIDSQKGKTNKMRCFICLQ